MHPRSPVQSVRQQAFRLLWVQWALVALAVVLTAGILNLKSAGALGLGGLAALLPHTYFAWKFFREGGASAMKRILSAFYGGEVLKLLLTALLVVLIWRFFKPEMLPFLIGFGLAQSGVFLAPLIIK